MYYYHTNDEIDEIGEGIIRKYNYQAFIQGDPTDIEGFIADHLNYRIVYDRLADKRNSQGWIPWRRNYIKIKPHSK